MTPADDQPRKRTAGRRKGPWSQAEIEKLKRTYGLRPDAQIARELRRSVESVRRLARMVFSGEPKAGPWSAVEVQALKNYIGAAEIEKISLILRRSSQEIRRKVEELQGNPRSGPWSSEDTQTLKRLYGTRTNEDLSLILGRTIEDIQGEAKRLCLAKDKGFRRRRGADKPTRMPRWSNDEVALLRDLYPDHPNLEIARRLSRSVKSVVSKAHDLGLRKTTKRLREMGRENVNLRYRKPEAREEE